jgi:peptidyl-Lys metalloendopeptidase
MKLSLCSTALLAALSATPAFAGDIEVTIDAAQQQFAAGEDVRLTVTLHNSSNKPQRILRWYTPADGLQEDLFDISVNGQEAAYTGKRVKRQAPSAQDYISLRPGESRQYQVELTAAYDLPQSGNYQIEYHVEALALHAAVPKLTPQQQLQAEQMLVDTPVPALRSDAIYRQIDVDTNTARDIQWPALVTLAGSVSYAANCSSSRRTSIAGALTAAKNYATGSYNYLSTYPSASRANSARYKTWFGSYTSSRWSTVSSNFNKINNALHNQPLQFDCGCTDSYYAYVYPNQPYKIYLCSAFWSAANTGTDSKAGTIVHETSHFTVVADTDDIAYGQTAAKSLALSNPAQAVKNADSHEYFAENTPAQN